MDQRINNRDKDDPRFLSGKDKKKDKKYYGKFLILIILIIISIEYYAYVFEVKIYESKKLLFNCNFINNISYFSFVIINSFYINHEYKSRRNTFILGILYR